MPVPTLNSSLTPVFAALKLVMLSGKGGVGKTTLSCAIARQLAQTHPSEKILLISTDPAHSLGDVLQMTVTDTPQAIADLPNLQVRALDAQVLLQGFKADYGRVLETLVERGSFVEGEDLTPVWDLDWPGLDELMGILEIQRLLRDREADRVVVDMAPSGHTLNLFGLMDFLDEFLAALALFQEKHRTISESLTGRYIPDEADRFLAQMQRDLAEGRQLLQDRERTNCWVVAIAEPMSFLETERFMTALEGLNIPVGGLWVNRIAQTGTGDRLQEQFDLLSKFHSLGQAQTHPVFVVPQQPQEPTGMTHLDALLAQVTPLDLGQFTLLETEKPVIQWPEPIPPGLPDYVSAGRRLLLIGGKGGVGKTTVAAAIAYALAQKHPQHNIRAISIDPAHSLGDALGTALGHEPTQLQPNLSAQEVDADRVLDQFRQDYLWELAQMMSGESGEGDLQLAYGPEAWRRIASQALPGIDEMLSLVTVMELLERQEQDLIILDTAPTGHLLRFLAMPTALGDWLAWIFKLWIKYQAVLGRTELMGRLRTLRQRVMQAQKLLKDPQHTEFIGVVQTQEAILAEAERLTQSLSNLGVAQPYLVHNRYEGTDISGDRFPDQTLVRLPVLPRSVTPLERIAGAAQLLLQSPPSHEPKSIL